MRVVDAAPAAAARRPQTRFGAAGTGHFDLEAEAERVLAAAERKRLRQRRLGGRLFLDDDTADLVRQHLADRRVGAKPLRPGTAAVQEQLHGAAVTGRRREQ